MDLIKKRNQDHQARICTTEERDLLFMCYYAFQEQLLGWWFFDNPMDGVGSVVGVCVHKKL